MLLALCLWELLLGHGDAGCIDEASTVEQGLRVLEKLGVLRTSSCVSGFEEGQDFVRRGEGPLVGGTSEAPSEEHARRSRVRC